MDSQERGRGLTRQVLPNNRMKFGDAEVIDVSRRASGVSDAIDIYCKTDISLECKVMLVIHGPSSEEFNGFTGVQFMVHLISTTS